VGRPAPAIHVDPARERYQGCYVTSQPVDSTLVITHSGWWDCPRQGIVAFDGLPHYFASDFSDELDDYDPSSGSGLCQMRR